MSESSVHTMQDVFEQNLALWQHTQSQFTDWMKDGLDTATTPPSPDPTAFTQTPYSQMVGTDMLFGADRKAMAFMDAIMKLAGTSSELNGVMGQAWVEAYQRYSTTDVHKDELADVMSAVNAWFNYANDALLHCQRTQEFLEAQRNYVKASTECRNRYRELMEVLQEQHQMPTRSEVDDLSQTVYELRKEVRALKRQLKQQREVPAATEEAMDTPTDIPDDIAAKKTGRAA